MGHPSLFVLQLLILIVFAFPAQAVHYIDDSDPIIQYSGITWSHWGPYAVNGTYGGFRFPNSTYLIFNYTLSQSSCVTEDNCHVTIPFTGSGIQIINLLRESIIVNFTVDEGSPTTYEFENNLNCWLNVSLNNGDGCFNQSIYEVHDIGFGNHSLDMAIMTPRTYNFSDFFFDYAIVDDTGGPSSSSSSSTASSSPSSTSVPLPSPKKHPLAAITGSIVGGGSIIIIIVAVALCYRRRNRNIGTASIDPIPFSNRTASPSYSPLPGGKTNPTSLAATDFEPRLTREQLDVVEGLYRRNLPPSVIADMVERMLANPETTTTMGSRGAMESYTAATGSNEWTGMGAGLTEDAPPGYHI